MEIYVGCITPPTELSSLASKPKLVSTGFKYRVAILTPFPEGPHAMGTSHDTILPQHLPPGPWSHCSLFLECQSPQALLVNFQSSLEIFLVLFMQDTFPGGTRGKEPACQFRKPKRLGFDPWVRKIPWRRKWQPTPAFVPGDSHGQRSLVGQNPWGRRVRHDWAPKLMAQCYVHSTLLTLPRNGSSLTACYSMFKIVLFCFTVSFLILGSPKSLSSKTETWHSVYLFV